jgi:hypothetical protein
MEVMMKNIFLSIVAILFLILLVTCNSNFGTASLGGREGDRGDGDYVASSPEGGYSDTEGNGNRNRPDPGQLSCGEWSDIKNYEFYLNLFNAKNNPDAENSQQRQNYLQFVDYFGFNTRSMLTINVVCDSAPVDDAVVELYGPNQNSLFSAKTDMRGNAYLFPSYDLNGENITVKAKSGSYESIQSFVYTEDNVQISLNACEGTKSVLDLMFVIDTTGSMGDEIRYLKS